MTEIINEDHENKKYLPGVQLPENVVAVPDIGEAVKGATAIVFVMPHQCMPVVISSTYGRKLTTSPQQSPLYDARQATQRCLRQGNLPD